MKQDQPVSSSKNPKDTAAKRKSNVKTGLNISIKIALLSALAFGLMYLEFPLTMIFPPWLRFDFGDIPALIGSFAFGPWAGILIELIKNALHMAFASTGGVGELANFLLGVALVLPISLYYYWKKKRGIAIASLSIGVILMSALSAILNLYILIPLYFGNSQGLASAWSGAGAGTDPMMAYILYAAVPFTFLKAFIEALITFLVYKRLSKVLHRN